MEKEETKLYASAIVALTWLIGGLYYLLRTRLEVSVAYDSIYADLILYSIIGAVLVWIVDYTKLDGEAESIFERSLFLAGKDDTVPIQGSSWMKAGIGLGLGLLVLLVIGSRDLSFFSVPVANGPTLAASTSSFAVVDWAVYFFTAVIPGLFEELIVFLLISFAILLSVSVTSAFVKDAFENMYVLWFWRVTYCLVGALAFSFAHAQYVGNGSMNAWAVIFEFTVQMFNQLTGGFISWIPHMMHNAGVVYFQSLALAPLAIFGVLLMYSPKLTAYAKKRWL